MRRVDGKGARIEEWGKAKETQRHFYGKLGAKGAHFKGIYQAIDEKISKYLLT